MAHPSTMKIVNVFYNIINNKIDYIKYLNMNLKNKINFWIVLLSIIKKIGITTFLVSFIQIHVLKFTKLFKFCLIYLCF